MASSKKEYSLVAAAVVGEVGIVGVVDDAGLI